VTPRLLTLALLLAACGGDGPPGRPCDCLGLLCSENDELRSLDLTRSRSHLADLEGDGKLDLVTASSDGSLSIAWGHNGQRDYRLHPGGVPDVQLGDLDRDGYLDLVYITAEPSALHTRINLGARQFSDGPTIAIAGEARSLWLGRLDADASLDAVVASAGASTITVITDGLTRAVPIVLGRELVAVDLGDLNDDGRLDLVAVDRSDAAFYVVLAQGDAFAAPRRVATGLTPELLQLHDLDGDDRLDVLTHGKGPEIWFHQGDGSGGFSPARALLVQPTASPGFAAHRDEQGRRWLLTITDQRLIASELGDADQVLRRVVSDGFYQADGLTMDAGAPLVHGASFTTRHSLAPAQVFTEIWRAPSISSSLVWADLDHDDIPELTTAEQSGVVIRARQPDGTWAERSRLDLAQDPGVSAIAAAELTGDAHPDLVIGDFESKIHVAIGHGDGSFTLGEPSPIDLRADLLRAAPVADQPASVLAASTLYQSVGLVALRFDADGHVTAQTALSTTARAVSLATADLDDDGDHDLVAVLREPDDDFVLHVFPATPTGWDPPRSRSLSALFPADNFTSAALALDDLDLDGTLDGLLAINAAIVRLPDLGADSPPAPQRIDFPQIAEADAIAIADVDADGELDLAVCRHGGPAIVLGSATGEFLAQPQVAQTYVSCALHVDPTDLRPTAAIVTDRGVAVLTPSLAPGLTELDRFSGGPAPLQQLETGDIDADGHPDVVVVANTTRAHSFAVLWGSADGRPKRATWQEASRHAALTVTVAPLDDRPGDEIVVASDRGNVDIWTHDRGALELLTSATPGDDTHASAVGVQRHQDGSADIILFGRDGPKQWALTALPRDLSGAFVDPKTGVPLASGAGTFEFSAMTIADLDREGHDDIAVAGEPSMILWGDPERVVHEQQLITDDFVTRITHADLDGDGAPTLIVATAHGLMRIDFTGRSQAAPVLLARRNALPTSLHFADLEADGRADILHIADNILDITLRAPTGDDRFLISLEPAWSQLRAADLDGDGILDLLGLQDGNLVTRLSAPQPAETP